ncbi:dipeptidase [Acaryochloris sp. IP29b_bin.137]|uniref:dipeptidase n=1 Tax=Acaryochloris sp. IP29b_bin.137 TaxID=2969217 RepID=UPI00262F4345|nr:dipeptidase [Acaryochloris sp. IP29b_bin.137]
MSRRRQRFSKPIKRWVILGVIGFAIALYLIFAQLPTFVDKRLNPVLTLPPYSVPAEAAEVHDRLWVADLHADSLLWGRDLSQRHQQGHIDLPRLQTANVALQIFTVVTQVPSNLKLEGNTPDSDDIIKLAVVQGWPLATWHSLLARALHQGQQLHTLAQSQAQFRLIETQSDLQRFIRDRKQQPQLTAGILGLEGAHALEGRLENVERLYQAGFRMLGLAHFFDTEVGGSAHGSQQGGLTPLGRQVVLQAQEKHMLLDLAHSSSQVINEVVALSRQPVVVSHTGVKGTCDNVRNLSDRQIKAIANTGGVIGIGFWPRAVCGDDAQAIAQAIRYVADLVGVDHVSLGSDFDGAVHAPFDVTGLPLLTAALQAEGFSTEEIGKIMGGNTLRVLQAVLPA